jgi:hypothetical protein
MSDLLIRALDEAIWELSEAFREMPDADLWCRADPRLLSVGELACHIAYGEATSLPLEGLESPLLIEDARYYPVTIDGSIELEMSAEALFQEVQRVHDACKAAFLALNPDLEAVNPLREDWTWGYTLRYQAFHIAYHTGQIYSARHLLGHTTPDN